MPDDDDVAISSMRALVNNLTRASSMLDDKALGPQQRLWSIMQRLQKSRWDRCIEAARRDKSPAMQIYLSDGWGCNISESILLELWNDKSTRREVRKRSEFLLERVILKVLGPSGKVSMAMRSMLPREMLGKTAWHVFGGCLGVPLLRQQLHEGIVLTVYLQDGLHFRNFKKKAEARHRLFYEGFFAQQDDVANWTTEQNDWVFVFWCVLHLFGLAMKWGLAAVTTRKDLVDDVHITIASLRNGSGALLNCVHSFR